MIFATVSYHTFMAIKNIHATRVTTKGRAASIPSSSMQSETVIDNTYETLDYYEKPPPLNYVMSYAVLTDSDLREPLMESFNCNVGQCVLVQSEYLFVVYSCALILIVKLITCDMALHGQACRTWTCFSIQ